MHFPIALVEESFSTYGLLNVYSATRQVPERTLEIFRQWGTQLTNPEPGSLQEIVDRLHNEYLSHVSDKFAGIKEQIGWHMAFCMLSFVVFSEDRCWVVHLGNRTVGRVEPEGVVRITPIHDLRHEYAEHTLDEAGLPELSHLTTEMAERLVDVPAGRLTQLQGKTSDELAELLGDFYTRVIGDHYGELTSHDHGAKVELISHNAFISSIPLFGELNLVMLEPPPGAQTAALDESKQIRRKARLEVENKWPSQNIDEVRVTETTPLASQNLGIKIHWRQGHPVEAYLLAARP